MRNFRALVQLFFSTINKNVKEYGTRPEGNFTRRQLADHPNESVLKCDDEKMSSSFTANAHKCNQWIKV